MRKSFQWIAFLTLAFALALFMAPVGVANGNDDDDGDCDPAIAGHSCDDDNDDGDDDDEDEGDDEGEEDGTCGCPGESAEFLVGNFTCEGNIPTLKLHGSSGVGNFEISGAPVADPNACIELGTTIETAVTAAGCTSAGLVTTPAVALTFICAGERDDIVETEGDVINPLLTFSPSTPLVMNVPSSSTSLVGVGRVGRRR